MWVHTASSQQTVTVLKVESKSKRSQKRALLFADTNDSLLRKADTRQIRQVLGASLAVLTFAASSARGARWLSKPSREEDLSTLF